MSKKPDYCPDWFDVANYEACKDYTRLSWSMGLSTRAYIYRVVQNKNELGQKLEYWKNAIIKNATKQEISHFSGAEWNKEYINELGENEYLSIADFSKFDFCYFYEVVKRQSPDLIKNIEENIGKQGYTSEDGDVTNWQEIFWDEDIREARRERLFCPHELDAHIYIDLQSSDKEILSDLKKWLKFKRATVNTAKIYEKGFPDRKLKEYAELQILAYIDLYLWCKLTETKLTDIQMGNLLYPNEFNVDVTERVRRVTAPKAHEFLKHGIYLLA